MLVKENVYLNKRKRDCLYRSKAPGVLQMLTALVMYIALSKVTHSKLPLHWYKKGQMGFARLTKQADTALGLS